MEYIFPQEVEVWYIIPLVRKEIAIELKKLGMNNTEIAKKLAITKSAVSQYLSGKRASKIQLDEDARKTIQQAALRIKNGSSIITEMNKIITSFWKAGVICELHKTVSGIEKSCKLCRK